MPIIPLNMPVADSQNVLVQKPPKTRAKKAMPDLAANSPVVPSPLLRANSVETSLQTATNAAISPSFPATISSPPIAAGVSVDTLSIALVCSDLHLSPGPPAARIEEPDWPKAVESQMFWLFEQAKTHNVPLVIAGDIFDKAIADSRFISSVIALFQKCDMPIYVVPGNHDLPYHSYANRHESAYGILEITGVIRNIDQTITYKIADKTITLHGYYWNRPFSDSPPFDPEHLNIAVIHKYVYDTNTSYFGADIAGHCDNQLSAMQRNYDFLIYGDNHTPFQKQIQTSTLINCGSFFRRSQNDKNLKPAAYLLKSDRSFETIYVSLEGQSFLQQHDASRASANLPDYSELSEFFEEQSGMDNLTLQDSFVKFVATTNPVEAVKECLSRITGLAVG